MKRLLFLPLTAAFLLCLYACSKPDVVATATVPTETTCPETVQTSPSPEETVPESVFSYSLLEYRDFLLSSGAGGWGTDLHIESDGSFSGVYHDSEMGDNAPDYPHGTVYYCAFSGQLGAPVQLDSHTWQLPILTIQYSHTPDTQEIKDSIRYCYTTAFGLEGSRELLLYMPGTSVNRLPAEYWQWVQLAVPEQAETLSFYGLYNKQEQLGFSSCHRLEHIHSRIQEVESADQILQTSLEEAATQTDRNQLAQQRYEMWDGLLNELWAVLKQIMEPDAFSDLTREQLDWIGVKEEAASDAAAEFEGGSLAPMAWSVTAADMTKVRLYYLMTYLPE